MSTIVLHDLDPVQTYHLAYADGVWTAQPMTVDGDGEGWRIVRLGGRGNVHGVEVSVGADLRMMEPGVVTTVEPVE